MESKKDLDDRKEKRKKWARILFGTAGAFILFDLWLLTPRALSFFYETTSVSETGAIGDTYGAFNGLVSGGAMIALVFSIYLQRKDLAKQSEQLELQREEMKLTREEMENQRAELALSSKAMRDQVQIASMTAQLSLFPAMIEELRKSAKEELWLCPVGEVRAGVSDEYLRFDSVANSETSIHAVRCHIAKCLVEKEDRIGVLRNRLNDSDGNWDQDRKAKAQKDIEAIDQDIIYITGTREGFASWGRRILEVNKQQEEYVERLRGLAK